MQRVAAQKLVGIIEPGSDMSEVIELIGPGSLGWEIGQNARHPHDNRDLPGTASDPCLRGHDVRSISLVTICCHIAWTSIVSMVKDSCFRFESMG